MTLKALHHVLFQIVLLSNIVVLVVYWGAIYYFDRQRPEQQDVERWLYTAVLLHTLP